VTVQTGDLIQTAQVGSDGSYLSQCDLDLHFGLGPSPHVDQLTIDWPDGDIDRYQNIEGHQTVTYKR
jgi:hypothetical protein